MIIVTGGRSGIGHVIVSLLRKEGESVITLSRRNLDESEHISCDLSDFKSLELAYKSIKSRGCKVKAIINCAGIASMNLVLTTPPDVVEKIIQTNLIGTIYLNQIFAPLLIKNGGGSIINFSTIAVSSALKGEAVYIASKAGVEAFSRTLAKELSPFNITVNCIAPGPIKTDLIKAIPQETITSIVKSQIINREMQPEDVFSMIKLLLSPNARELTGQTLHLGGF